jgi:hypothetical protein
LNGFRELVSILLLVFLLQSCAGWVKSKDYYPFDTSELDKLIPGKSNAAEITQILGAPSEIVKLTNGNAYIYRVS